MTLTLFLSSFLRSFLTSRIRVTESESEGCFALLARLSYKAFWGSAKIVIFIACSVRTACEIYKENRPTLNATDSDIVYTDNSSNML